MAILINRSHHRTFLHPPPLPNPTSPRALPPTNSPKVYLLRHVSGSRLLPHPNHECVFLLRDPEASSAIGRALDMVDH